MKICLLSPQYFPTLGGVPVLVDLWGKAFERAGHTVTVATTEQARDAGRGGKFSPLTRPGPAQLVRALRQADVVVSLQECLSLSWPLALGIVKRPCLVSLQMHPPEGRGLRSQMKKAIRKRLFRSSVVCACSKYVAADVMASESVPVHVVHNAYDDQVFHCQGNEPRDIDILYVGRLAIHKRCDVLLEAVSLLQTKWPEKAIVIAGDGPEEGSLMSLAADAGLRNCKFEGPVDAQQAAALMRRSRILVVPSGYEPFGIVVLEGLASGCHVITSDAGGLREAGGGFTDLFKVNSSESLAKTLHAVTQDSLQGSEPELAQIARYLSAHTPAAIAAKLLSLVMN